MDLQARPLQYFLAVAQERSFSRAAAQLNVSQPALSAQIRELERLLGFALFERTSRQVTLTREGRLFVTDARRMVAQSARLLRAATEIRRTDLRIGTAIYTALIPERVRLTTEFHRLYPEIPLHIQNLFQVDQYPRLRNGDLDLALGIGLVPTQGLPALDEAGSEIVFPPDFERLTLRRKWVELLVPESSPFAARGDLSLPDLAGQKIVMLGDAHGAELIDALSLPLVEAGAELIVPPEGNAIAVEQYGRSENIAAISLGWMRYAHDRNAGTSRRVAGLDVMTELAVLRVRAQEHRSPVDTFWHFAGQHALASCPD